MASSSPLDDLLFDHKEFAFLTGYIFRGLTISESGVGWNIVLRAFGHSQEALYCMTQHDEPREGLQLLLGALSTKSGPNLWRPDKYYKCSG